ncbi:MAG: type II secretion system protein GspD [Planctomycetota bacterium]|jgi:type II secretory pathway component GspD/PulD (secretin)
MRRGWCPPLGRVVSGWSLVLAAAALWAVPAGAQGPSPDKPPQDDGEVVARDYYFMRDDLVRNKDGTVTWFYVTNHVGATTLKQSLDELKIPGLKTATRQRDTFSFRYKTRERRVDLDQPPQRKPGADENTLLLTFPPAYKDIIEEFLERFDIPEAQVYIKAKVVEVTLDSNLEYGVSWFFDRGGGNPTTGVPGTDNPNAFFRSFRSQFRPGSFSGAVLSPENTGLSLLFDDLTTDEGTLVATIEALQERGSANILSEPSIVATQGQLASLHTGESTPVQEIKITGSSETITTIFKETGIKLDFHPLHIGRDYVKLRVRVEVSSITGFVTAASSNFVVQNPVIAQRNAESVVSIRDGMTLVIGGLYALSEIEDKSGIPILADIPILSFFFSKKRKTKVKSELDFFITPYILRQRLAKSVFVPPGEKRRLQRLKESEDSE